MSNYTIYDIWKYEFMHNGNDFPEHSASSFVFWLSFIGKILAITISHEFYFTLISCFLPQKQPKNLHTRFFERINDVFSAITNGVVQTIANILTRTAYIPFALIGILFSISNFLVYLFVSSLATFLAISLNISHVVINNLTIHVLLLSFGTHLYGSILSALCIIFDSAAKDRFYRGIKGLKHSFYSLYVLLANVITSPISILLLGTQNLDMPYQSGEKAIPIEEQYLKLVDTKGANIVCGIDRNLTTAVFTFYTKLSNPLVEAMYNLAYIVSTPVFGVLEVFIFSALLLCSLVKLVMTGPLLLIQPATSSFFHTKQSNSQPLLLVNLRKDNEKVFADKSNPKIEK